MGPAVWELGAGGVAVRELGAGVEAFHRNRQFHRRRSARCEKCTMSQKTTHTHSAPARIRCTPHCARRQVGVHRRKGRQAGGTHLVRSCVGVDLGCCQDDVARPDEDPPSLQQRIHSTRRFQEASFKGVMEKSFRKGSNDWIPHLVRNSSEFRNPQT